MQRFEAPETTMNFHAQDWVIVIEALTAYSGEWENLEPRRARRADELIEAIANEQDVSSPEMIRQTDSDWPLQGR